MGKLKTIEDIAVKPNPDFDQLLKVLWRDGIPNYVPFYELFADREIMEAVTGKQITDAISTVEFYYKAGYDYVPVWPGVSLQVGSLIDTTSDYPIKNWQTFERYCWPDESSISVADFEAVSSVLPDGMKMIGQTGGIFETVEGLCGYNGLCYMLYDDRDLVYAIFSRVGELYESMYSKMAEINNVGALVVSDDLGFKHQTLISPADLREFVLPWHKRLAEIAHSHGKPCILHSCGQLAAVMDDIIEDVKVDAKHSYEDSIMPVTEAKKLYGDRIAILGGFDVDRLARSTISDIREYVRVLLETCGVSGGYALGTGNSVAHYVPVEHYLAMLDEGWRMR
jgi:uroporphyrinogen decarboxylase